MTFDLCRLDEGSHETTATRLLARATLPPVLTDAAAATLLAVAAPPPVLADAAAAALLALAALPPMLTDAFAAALLAGAALPSMLANAAAATLLAVVANPPVLADSFAAALLTNVALPPVLADAAAAAVLAFAAPPPVLADAAAAAVLALPALPPVLADAAAAALLALAALPPMLAFFAAAAFLALVAVSAGHLPSRSTRLHRAPCWHTLHRSLRSKRDCALVADALAVLADLAAQLLAPATSQQLASIAPVGTKHARGPGGRVDGQLRLRHVCLVPLHRMDAGPGARVHLAPEARPHRPQSVQRGGRSIAHAAEESTPRAAALHRTARPA